MSGENKAAAKKKNASAIMRKRKIVKNAMIFAMAATVVTGFGRGKGHKQLHIASGIALVGLSIYHNYLYPENMKS
ncbi:hypothetical protein EP073_05625 [Geovibrio thiophilus]|uniref:Uncharacterized protein n=1 Tax=Geovibrio thiophilus TaxID=139438 RepID=A0A3R5Y6J8_9BACT|nr:hypothetical protein [Geovibrio thiophilus]QAR32901.1 hypothetical protein EP073_05625 [Geovibrio thiophilus]